MTLLLGPPSGGKSVLLQALSGRLRPSRNLKARVWGGVLAACVDGRIAGREAPSLPLLRPSLLQIEGSIRYNGLELSQLQPRRTAGLVQQLDNHIPGRVGWGIWAAWRGGRCCLALQKTLSGRQPPCLHRSGSSQLAAWLLPSLYPPSCCRPDGAGDCRVCVSVPGET